MSWLGGLLWFCFSRPAGGKGPQAPSEEFLEFTQDAVPRQRPAGMGSSAQGGHVTGVV